METVLHAVVEAVALGRNALGEARWAEARAHFERAAAIDPDSAAALDGMSEARWWLGEWHEARELRERAFVRHRAVGARREAAAAAIWLANEYLIATGNRGAWNGWLERAAGLLEGLDPVVEHGWLWFSRGRRLDDPKQMEDECLRAFELARSAGDVDLEIVAVSQIGRALVVQRASPDWTKPWPPSTRANSAVVLRSAKRAAICSPLAKVRPRWNASCSGAA
jgi:tetratricopeptide (TPR) repeat protein